MITRPLKAPTNSITKEQVARLQFPVFASDKEDGIRCINHPTFGPVSQKFLPIPNDWIRHCISQLPIGLDGEIVIPGMDFNDIQSIVMSRRKMGQADFRFLTFDDIQYAECHYDVRYQLMRNKYETWGGVPEREYWKILTQTQCDHESSVWLCYEDALKRKKEGLMLRDPRAPYKSGRSTLREQFLLKLKPTETDEAIIIDFIEQFENCNAATHDEWGLSKRSKHLANLRGKGTLGAFVCEWRGHVFNIGSGIGLTAKLRQKIWDNKSAYKSLPLTFRYQASGMKTLPRSPQFLGFRRD